VKYTTAAALVNELVEAADDKTLSRTIARYGRVDLLCLDELGYLELDRRGAELLFQVFTEREERASIAIASNAAFSKSAHVRADLCEVAPELHGLRAGEEGADVGGQDGHLLSAFDPGGDRCLPGVLPGDPWPERPAQFDVTTGVKGGGEREVVGGPGAFAAPSPEVSGQAVHEVGQVLGVPDGHEDITQVSVQPVGVEVDGEGRLMFVDELAIMEPDMDRRVFAASDGHLR
jgi:hypothetical protein